jgi:O-antigen ligase
MAVSLPLVLRRPLIGMMIYLGANIVRPEMLFWGGSAGSYFFRFYYVLLFLACALNGYILKLHRSLQREYLLMLWLLVAIFISTLFAQYTPQRGNYYIIEFIKDLGIFALIYVLVDDASEIKSVQAVFLGCFAFLGVWGIQQSFLGNERLEGLGGSSWGDSNGVAAMFDMFLPVALANIFICKKRISFWISMCAAIIMAATVICTKSRAGLLGAVTGLLAFSYYSRKSIRVGLLFCILLICILPFATQAYIDRMMTMKNVTQSEDLETSARSRFVLWQAGLMVFADNPVVGTGFLTYPAAKMNYEYRFSDLPDDFREAVFRKVNRKVTHNSYIQILSDCGLLGAIPFFLLVGGAIYKGFQARHLLKTDDKNTSSLVLLCGIAAGITGYAVCIFTIDGVLNNLFYVQVIFAAMIARFYQSSTPGDSELRIEGVHR